jgi:hypothetical protein
MLGDLDDVIGIELLHVVLITLQALQAGGTGRDIDALNEVKRIGRE